MKKKLKACLLAALAGLFVLGGCQKKEPAAGPDRARRIRKRSP